MTKQEEKAIELEVERDILIIKLEKSELVNKKLTEQLRIGIVSGRFNSDNNEENEKVLTAILYEHTDEKEMKIREVDYEEVVKDIMEYF